jgi:A118 family predicted phage portal protein
MVNGAKQFYIQTHYKDRITNVLLDDKGKPVALPVNMAAEYPTKQKCFQIVKPNVVNNLHLHQPLGMSIFANALDQARACDTVFDSMVNDFAVGRSRIMVPMKYAQVAQMADGTKRPVFDTADTVFTVFESANEGAKIEFVQPEIRAEQHKAGIQTALALFADKCGLGNDRYKFEKGSVQTATQVISEKSELYQNVQKHELLLNDALLEMIAAIAYHTGATYKEATVKFDDSIIEDKAAKKAAFISEINAGIRQPWEYRVEFLGEDKATAQAAIQAPATSDAGGFGDTGAGA